VQLTQAIRAPSKGRSAGENTSNGQRVLGNKVKSLLRCILNIEVYYIMQICAIFIHASVYMDVCMIGPAANRALLKPQRQALISLCERVRLISYANCSRLVSHYIINNSSGMLVNHTHEYAHQGTHTKDEPSEIQVEILMF